MICSAASLPRWTTIALRRRQFDETLIDLDVDQPAQQLADRVFQTVHDLRRANDDLHASWRIASTGSPNRPPAPRRLKATPGSTC